MKFLVPALLFLFSGMTTALAQGMAVSCPESAKYYSKDSVNVTTFGASTVEGVNGLDFQTSLEQNFKRCYPNKVISITKYGVGGETTSHALARLNGAMLGKTGFFVILVGVNDSWQIDDRRLSISETEANMRQIVRAVLARKLIPIVCTLQFFDDRNSARLKRMNNIIAQINGIYRNLAREEGAYLADLNRVMRRDFSLYQDTVHPNARGNRIISYVIFDTVNKIIAERFLQFTVSHNYPNPARNGRTTVDVVMPEPDKITINFYSIHGQQMRYAINEYLNTGKHSISIDLTSFPVGLYIYRISTSLGLNSDYKKLIVAR